MRAFVVASFAAACCAVAVCPVPAQVAPEPSASPAAQLPEIGRVRATSAACAAMRDLVIPAFAAARRADARFAETQKRLPKYGEIAGDPGNRTSVVRESELSKLSIDAANLLQESQRIAQLLADPRLANDVGDPSVAAERAQLQEVYAAQQTRAAILSEFVQRESTSLSRANVGMEDGHALDKKGGKKGGEAPVKDPQETIPRTPLPAYTKQPNGMPLLNSEFPQMNKATLGDWGSSAAKLVRDKENAAAKTFLPLAQGCR
jgi:hypothetical protein